LPECASKRIYCNVPCPFKGAYKFPEGHVERGE
jgi:hypothetical protein